MALGSDGGAFAEAADVKCSITRPPLRCFSQSPCKFVAAAVPSPSLCQPNVPSLQLSVTREEMAAGAKEPLGLLYPFMVKGVEYMAAVTPGAIFLLDAGALAAAAKAKQESCEGGGGFVSWFCDAPIAAAFVVGGGAVGRLPGVNPRVDNLPMFMGACHRRLQR